MALGRKALEAGESFQLKEDQYLYIADFEAKKSDIASKTPMLGIKTLKMQRLSLARARRPNLAWPDPGGRWSAFP